MAGFALLLVAQPGPARSASGPVASGLLSGRTVAIDPGHGGWDPGAVGRVAREDQINLAVSLDLRRWLELAGAHVVMTWSSLREVPPDRRYRVQERMELVNASDASALVDIHCNSGQAAHGPEVLYWEGVPSRLLADNVSEELHFFTHTHRAVRRIHQYVLRHAAMPAINVELGFINNAREEQLLTNPRYQNQLAWYIFIGLERWYLKGHWPASWLETTPPPEFISR